MQYKDDRHHVSQADPQQPVQNELAQAFARLQAEVLGTLYHLVGNLEDAQDAYQEAFLKCWKHRRQLDEIENLRAWIFRIALNTGRDFRKSAWKRRTEPIGPDELTHHAPSPPLSKLEEDEEVELLRRGIRLLRPEERQVFLLRENGEMTYEQIAETLKLPVGTVKTRMRNAIKQLRLYVSCLQPE